MNEAITPSEKSLPVRQYSLPLDVLPVHGTVHTLPPIDLQVVSQSCLESLWDDLVRRYHYLGFQRLLGHRLKYLAFIKDRPVAALSFSAPALKLRVRDHHIGWSAEQRQAHLERIVNNSRFLILPWVEVKNLASHLLARALARITHDWEERFRIRLWMVETFVDPARFAGTCYRAANWQYLGQTSGSGKAGKGYVYHGSRKDVYFYVLEPRFRKLLGCDRKSYNLFHRSSPTLDKANDLHVRLHHADWNPDIVPWMDFTKSDRAALADELIAFHDQFNPLFGRKEHRRLGLAYLSGLLSKNESRSIEHIALTFLDKQGVRSLQRFLKSYAWDHGAMEQANQTMLAPAIADADGMVTVVGCDFLKKGKESVGVTRQYCDRYGKVDNCQSGVYVGYSSRKGYGLLAGRLFMPASWFSPEQKKRRKDNLVPQDLVFKTKPQIAAELIENVNTGNQFPAKWISCDAGFGSDWEFLESLPQGKYYFAAIRSNTQVYIHKPVAEMPPCVEKGYPQASPLIFGNIYTVEEIALSNKCSWCKVVLAEGSNGSLVADVARLRVYPLHNELPKGYSVWIFLHRREDGQLKYALSNAPEDATLSELCEAATMHWQLEQCFHDAKSELGIDVYEHRSWPAWHRHMIYVFLKRHFILRSRIRFKK